MLNIILVFTLCKLYNTKDTTAIETPEATFLPFLPTRNGVTVSPLLVALANGVEEIEAERHVIL